MKSSVNPFADTNLIFFDSLFNSLLFDVTFFTWLLKSDLFMKIAISFLLAKCACFNVAAKSFDVNLFQF